MSDLPDFSRDLMAQGFAPQVRFSVRMPRVTTAADAIEQQRDRILRGEVEAPEIEERSVPHRCEASDRFIAIDEVYGPAITDIVVRADGTAWAGNDEYGTRIVFCPFCGERVGREEIGDDG